MSFSIRSVTVTAAIAAALTLAGCGSSSKGSSASSDVNGDNATATTAATNGKKAADVDVCALLSQSDANDVARAHGLDGAQTDATTYKLTSTKEAGMGDGTTSGCKFTIADDGAQGTVSFQVQSASGFSLYSSGTKIDGLGDEAYSSLGSPVVRVGSLMIAPGEDSFTNDFTTDLLRKMAPHLK